MATAQAPLRPVALPPVAALLRPVTLAACFLLLVPWLVLVVVNDASLLGAVAGTTTVLAFAAVGFVLAGRLPRHPVPWIFCAAAFLFALIFLADEYARWGLTSGAEPGVGVLLATWSTGWLFAPILGAVALFLPLLFPDGRLPSRRWRPVAWAAAGYVVLATLGNAFAEQETGPTGAPNPYATDGLQPLWTVLRGVAAVLMVVAFAGAVASVVVRLVRTRGDERQQMKWFASAAVLLPLAVLLDVWSRQAVIVAFALAPPLLAVAIAVAILRYRLYAIDTILNRTLVYATLTAVVAGLYVGTVSGLARSSRSARTSRGRSPPRCSSRRSSSRCAHGCSWRSTGCSTATAPVPTRRSCDWASAWRPRGRRRWRCPTSSRRRPEPAAPLRRDRPAVRRAVGAGRHLRRARRGDRRLPPGAPGHDRRQAARRATRGRGDPQPRGPDPARRPRATGERGGVRRGVDLRPGALARGARHRPGGGATAAAPRPARRTRAGAGRRHARPRRRTGLPAHRQRPSADGLGERVRRTRPRQHCVPRGVHWRRSAHYPK
jgi:hypothetical protein